MHFDRLFGLDADLAHRLDRLDRISAGGGSRPDSITASVPSSTALATSEPSARVGTGFWIIDSIICVAVIVSLFAFQRHPDHLLLQAGDPRVADFDGEVAARDHDAVDVLRMSSRLVDRLGALDLGDQQAQCRRTARSSWRAVYMSSPAFGNDTAEVIGAELDRGPDVVHVLRRQCRCCQAAALAVDAPCCSTARRR
jgi:hypothetical protein